MKNFINTSALTEAKTTVIYLAEACAWVLGVGLLALMEPGQEHLLSLCPFSWVFADGCPGCGLGNAIAFLFRGDWQHSPEAHPLALPALLVLIYRVVVVLRFYTSLRQQTTHS